MKKCAFCKQTFSLEEMRRSYCKSCKTELEKKRNPNRMKWNKDNKELNKQYLAKYTQQQRQDPLRNFMWHCGIGINRAIKIGWYNDKRMKDWVGLTPAELRAYLQSQWQEGMNWENYGRGNNCWSVDHIIPPYSSQNEQEIIQLQHYTNLQPLWYKDNIIKRNKRA
jgi:hypothetical protein